MYEVLCTSGLHIVAQYKLYLYILPLLQNIEPLVLLGLLQITAHLFMGEKKKSDIICSSVYLWNGSLYISKAFYSGMLNCCTLKSFILLLRCHLVFDFKLDVCPTFCCLGSVSTYQVTSTALKQLTLRMYKCNYSVHFDSNI